MSATLTVPEKVVEFLGYASAALDKADDAIAGHEKRAAAAKALIPQVVDELAKHERIRSDQREKCAVALRDPIQALQILLKVAGHHNADEIAALGEGVDPTSMRKTAGAGPANDPSTSLTQPFVGRRTTMIKQSSVNLFRRLGLPVPTNE